jgi:hypothetical protein
MVPAAPTGTAQQPPSSSVTSALAQLSITPPTPLVLAPAVPTFPSAPSHMPAPAPAPMPAAAPVPASAAAPVGTLVTTMPFNTVAPYTMDSPTTAAQMPPLIGSGRNHEGDTSMSFGNGMSLGAFDFNFDFDLDAAMNELPDMVQTVAPILPRVNFNGFRDVVEAQATTESEFSQSMAQACHHYL